MIIIVYDIVSTQSRSPTIESNCKYNRLVGSGHQINAKMIKSGD